MNRNYIFAGALLIVLAIILALIHFTLSSKSMVSPTLLEINGKDYPITAYAYTQAQQEKGLMNATITNQTLMMFYFSSPAIYPFWMKDTYSQLDMIWIYYNSSSKSGKVVYVVNATPCVNYSKTQQSCIVYTPGSIANYVFETKDGFVQRNNISTGDNVSLK